MSWSLSLSLSARALGLLAVASLLALGCDPARSAPAATAPPDAAPTTVDTVEGFEAFVSARGDGGSEDEAYEVARLALAAELFEDPSWAELAQVQTHRRNEDPQRVEPAADGRIVVTLGLDRTRAATIMSAFENATPEVDAPEPWQETLRSHARAHLAAHACARRQALFGSSCEQVDTRDVDDAVAELAGQVTLVASLPDGVPVDAQGIAKHGPAVYALWRGLPLSGIPVRVGSTGKVLLTDDHGRVTIDPPKGRAWTDLDVEIDAASLLGPQASDWAPAPLRLPARTRSGRRYGLLVVGPSGDEPVRAALAADLEGRGFRPAHAVPPPHDALVRRARAGKALPGLGAVAEALGGRFDVVMRVEYDCGFASRMGGNRVWFEATGTLTVYDAWSGAVLLHEQLRAKANGVTDARADQAARDKLAQTLAQRIATADEIPL
jgi:hypothetical protein